MKSLCILLLGIVLLFSGCVQEKAGDKSAENVSLDTVSGELPEDVNGQIDDSDLPYIEENDTVEIGEMI